MSETISRASVCEILADIYPTDGEKVVAVKEVDKAYEAIQQLPSVEPERKTGQWQEDPNSYGFWGYGFWICSACGFVSEASGADLLYNFCPNCGCDMREVNKNDG